MRKIYFLIITAMTFILSDGCNDNGDSSGTIKYLSYQNSGCISANSLPKTNSEAVLDWYYLDGNLRIDVSFTTHCSALMKDSVDISKNVINIFLADTNKLVAECICPYKETFNFIVSGTGELRILFSYKLSFKPEYFVLADTTIFVEQSYYINY
jgi:hypothetical protein